MIGLWIRSVWERKGISGKLLWLVLVPISWIYRLAVQFRNLLYSRGWLRVQALDRPVISIGNLTVGGTGKTPGCLWLAQELAKHGLKVAILSRGYK
jgi:tetraacyldisaccharide 4'-kinase